MNIVYLVLLCLLAFVSEDYFVFALDTRVQQNIQQNVNKPLGQFVENQGQWSSNVLFRHSKPNEIIWLTRSGFILDHFALQPLDSAFVSGKRRIHTAREVRKTGSAFEFIFSDRRFPTYNISAEKSTRSTEGKNEQPSIVNYISSEKQTFSSRIFTEAYISFSPEMSLHYSSSADALMRYDILLEKGVSPENIHVEVRGADSIQVENSSLIIHSGENIHRHEQLFAFQINKTGKRDTLPCEFVLKNRTTLSFHVPHYDSSRAIIIDPLVVSTTFGGSQNDIIESITQTSSGMIIVAGTTFSDNLPQRFGKYDTTLSGVNDGFIAAFSAQGNHLWTTYVGGSSGDEIAKVVILPRDEILVAGWTSSANFPTFSQSFSRTFNGGASDGFIAKFSADGSKLLASTYLGGNGNDKIRDVIIGDSTIICVGETGSLGFPVTASAFQKNLNGSIDGFVTVLNHTCSSVVASTYLGGNSNDVALTTKRSASGEIFVAGNTGSDNFPVSSSALSKMLRGSNDGFAVLLSSSCASLIAGTLLGGNQREEIISSSLDSTGFWLFGTTTSSDFPTTNRALDRTAPLFSKTFATKISSSCSYVLASTLFGETSTLNEACATHEGIFMVGKTGSAQFPTTLRAYDTTYNGGTDAFFAHISPNADTLWYATFLGGTQSDEALAVVTSEHSSAFVAGTTSSGDFPTTIAQSARQLPNAFLSKFTSGLECTFPINNLEVCAGQDIVVRWSANQVRYKTISCSLRLAPDSLLPLFTNVASSVGSMSIFLPQSLPTTTASLIFTTSNLSEILFSVDSLKIFAWPEIVRQPENSKICLGESATFTVELLTTATATYQWQTSIDGNSWSALSASNSPSLTLLAANISQNGQLVRAKITSRCGDIIFSNPAILTIVPPPIVTQRPQDQTICLGESAIFSVQTDSPEKLNFLWQTSRDGGRSWTNEQEISSTFRIINAQITDDNLLVRVVVLGRCAVATTPAILRFYTSPKLIRQPEAEKTICRGNTSTVTIQAQNFGQITWEEFRSDGVWHEISGATTEVFFARPNQQDTLLRLRAVVYGKCGEKIVSQESRIRILRTLPVSASISGIMVDTLTPCMYSATREFSLHNSSELPVTVQNIHFLAQTGLQVDNSAVIGKIIPPQSTLVISVPITLLNSAFTAHTNHFIRDTLDVTFTECASPIRISVEAYAEATALFVPNDSLKFGVRPVCSSALYRDTILLSNTSGHEISGVVPGLSAPFSVIGAGSQFALRPRETLPLVVEYQPTDEGNFSESLQIIYQRDACPDTVTIPIQGEARVLFAHITLSDSINRVLRSCQNQSDTTVVFENNSPFPVRLRQSMSGIHSQILDSFPIEIPAGSRQLLNVRTWFIGNENEWKDTLLLFVENISGECTSTLQTIIHTEKLEPKAQFEVSEKILRSSSLSPQTAVLWLYNKASVEYTIDSVTINYRGSSLASCTLNTSQRLPFKLAPADSISINIFWQPSITDAPEVQATLRVYTHTLCAASTSASVVFFNELLRPKLHLQLDSLALRVAEKQSLFLRADSAVSLMEFGAERIFVQISYNPTLFVINDSIGTSSKFESFHAGTIRANFPIIFAGNSSGVVAEIPIQATLGDAECTSIQIDSIYLFDKNRTRIAADISLKHGVLCLTDIYPKQFINPNSDGLFFSISPEPIENECVIKVNGISQVATFDIFTSLGMKVNIPVQHFTNENSSFLLDLSTLGTGVYIARLSESERSFSRRFIILR